MNSPLMYIGEKQTFTTPTGRILTIRENNGEDEGFLSTVKDATKSFGVNRYLSSIIVADHSKKGESPVSLEEVANWPTKDRYYTLFKARMLSLGSILNYSHACPNPDCEELENHFTEDLTNFDLDLAAYFELPKEERAAWVKKQLATKKYAVTPYPMGSSLSIEEDVSSGLRIKIDILTGLMEQAALAAADDTVNQNSSLTIRNFQVMGENGWQTEFTFKRFSSRQMVGLRGLVPKYDKGWEPISKAVCPRCKLPDYIPLLRNPDFFYPTEI